MNNFKECLACASESGTPELCSSCISNRNTIAHQAAEIARLTPPLPVERYISVPKVAGKDERCLMVPFDILEGIGDKAKAANATIATQAADITRLKEIIADVIKIARSDQSFAVKRVVYDLAETALEAGL